MHDNRTAASGRGALLSVLGACGMTKKEIRGAAKALNGPGGREEAERHAAQGRFDKAALAVVACCLNDTHFDAALTSAALCYAAAGDGPLFTALADYYFNYEPSLESAEKLYLQDEWCGALDGPRTAFADMRRGERRQSARFGLKVLDECAFAVLAVAEGGRPYAVPVSTVRIYNRLYFHSARTGKKTSALRRCPDVCLTAVGGVKPSDTWFTTAYESAIVYGRADEVTEVREKAEALRALAQRYTPNIMDKFDDALKKSFSRTAVWRLRITHLTAKAK